MKHFARLMVLFVLFAACALSAQADLMVFNSSNPGENAATRAAWLTAAGIAAPAYLVDFETGFTDGENIHGVTGLFPLGLVISDTDAGQALIDDDSINGSNPVGTYCVTQNEQPYLVLDFSVCPVDYVAFQDIDQAGTSAFATFTDGTTAGFGFETTAAGGDSAEFVGLYRNDMPRIVSVHLDASGDGRFGVDNIEYGPGCGEIPEPATLSLLALGGLGLLARRRR